MAALSILGAPVREQKQLEYFATANRPMSDDVSSLTPLGAIVKEQQLELRAIRALLESMNEKLKAVHEISENQVKGYARTDKPVSRLRPPA